MSWTIDIKADRDIMVEDVQTVVDELPEELHSFFGGTSRQPWGWSCAADIYNPKGRCLTIHGAAFSAGKADDMVVALKKGLKKLGYKTRKGRMNR